jgi:chromosome partitioning protein
VPVTPSNMTRTTPRDSMRATVPVTIRTTARKTLHNRSRAELRKGITALLEADGSSPSAEDALQRIGLPSTPQLVALVQQLIVTVAAHKGGVGKTELAKELAWLLAAVFIDFDWDRGGATRAWGYRHETRTNAPLLDAMETGRTPRPLTGGPFRADLVPSHPDWGNNQPQVEYLTGQLEKWSAEWRRPIVIDTHPGGGEDANSSAAAAITAANIVVVPIVLETKPLEALEGMADELRAFPLLIIPNMVNAVPKSMYDRLKRISEDYNIPVGPIVGKYGWLSQRTLRIAVAARTPLPARTKPFVDEITAVARAVIDYASKAGQESIA